jgi:hypothetical protein
MIKPSAFLDSESDYYYRYLLIAAVVLYMTFSSVTAFFAIYYPENIFVKSFLGVLMLLCFGEVFSTLLLITPYINPHLVSPKISFKKYLQMKKINGISINPFSKASLYCLFLSAIFCSLSLFYSLAVLPIGLYWLARALESELRANTPIYLLYLSMSGEDNLNVIELFYKSVTPLRLCHLLKENRFTSRWTSKQSLRLRDGDDWKVVVGELMDEANIILMDIRSKTPSLEYEIDLLTSKGYFYKTIFHVSGKVDKNKKADKYVSSNSNASSDSRDSAYIADRRKLSAFLFLLSGKKGMQEQPTERNPMSSIYKELKKEFVYPNKTVPSVLTNCPAWHDN